MYLRHRRNDRAHAHEQILYHIRDDHNEEGVVYVDDELAAHGHNEAERDDDAGRAGAERYEKIGDMAAFCAGS